MHELSEKLTQICTYVGIVLDGYYIEGQIESIAEEAIRRLKKMNTLVVIDNPSKLLN